MQIVNLVNSQFQFCLIKSIACSTVTSSKELDDARLLHRALLRQQDDDGVVAAAGSAVLGVESISLCDGKHL